MHQIPCQQLVRVITALCDDVATPVSACVRTHVVKGEWLELQRLRVDPADYTDANAFFKDTMVVDFLRKADITTSVDKRAAAVLTFFSCEAENLRTNQRLKRLIPGAILDDDPVDNAMKDFLSDWRKTVSEVLGALPLDLVPRFGPGSTFSDKGNYTTIPDKISGRPSVTKDAVDICEPFLRASAWGRALIESFPQHSQPQIVAGNRFTTVPKDAVKHRGICIEPGVNVAFQLDVGRFLRNRLMTIGIDLRNGQSVHRLAAMQASVDGLSATIDLSNASDTICRLLPELVLPARWFELLDSLRSKKTLIDGKWVYLEKFSSMGNGFTFELESLLFSTLMRTIVSRMGGDPSHVLTYGDDIIIGTEYAKVAVSALKYFGFTPNLKKTFLDGPFRESCGGDFFEGIPVRAHFLKELPYEPQHWITLANGLRRIARESDPVFDRWKLIHRAWRRCLDALPSDIRRLRGPVHLGDIVIHDRESEWGTWERPSTHVDGTCTFVRAYIPVANLLVLDHWKGPVQLAAALYGVDSSGVSPRESKTSGYKVKSVPLWGTGWTPPVQKSYGCQIMRRDVITPLSIASTA